MNLLYGEVVDIFDENNLRMGRIRVGGALTTVALELVPDAVAGDVVMICDGVAVSRVKEATDNVSGYSG